MRVRFRAVLYYLYIRMVLQNRIVNTLLPRKINSNKFIAIAISTNNTFLEQTKIMVASLENAGVRIRLYILNVNLTQVELEEIKIIAPDNVSVQVINVDEPEIEMLAVSKKWPVEAWTRIFIPQLINDEELVLYLDVDTVVVDSLEPLTKETVNPIVGVMNSYYSQKGQDSEMPHAVNSGVLLMNCQKLMDKDFTCRIIQYAKTNADSLIMPDQDSINTVCKDYMSNLEPKYNVMNYFFAHDYQSICEYSNKDFYSKRLFYDAIIHPAIIHYNGGPFARPWIKGKIKHPYFKIYKYYENKVKEEKAIRTRI